MSASALPFKLHGFGDTTAVLFVVVAARYFFFAGGFYWLFYRGNLAPSRKIRRETPPAGIIAREISWSLVTCFIFAVSGAALLHAWDSGHTRLYTRVEDHGWVWLVVSLPILMVLHETYFYWTHRWIHHPRIFRLVHRVHHESNNPTPWAAFSFHPWEALIQAIILPALVWVVPTHLAVLVAFLMVMTVLGVINHLGYEIYPRGFDETAIGREIIHATHHNLHHSRFKGNFGLYFTFWDRWMSTEVPDTNTVYREVTARPLSRQDQGLAV